MEKLNDLKTYKTLIEEVKLSSKQLFVNIDFLQADLESYIRNNQMFYKKTTSGILFFLDEKMYYRLYLCVNSHKELQVLPMEKKILVRNIYKEGQNSISQNQIEHYLIKCGFHQEGISIQHSVNTYEVVRKYKHLEKYKLLITRKGYQIAIADMELLDSLEEMLISDPKVKDYYLSRTFDKKEHHVKEGAYLCILNAKNEICAASIALTKNGIAKGMAIAVKDQYKMSGFAPLLSYERCRLLSDKNITYLQGWILNSNETSLRYHKKIGYKPTGRYANEWILNSKYKEVV